MTTQLPLPQSANAFTSWAQAESYVQDLLGRMITPATLDAWLADWTRLARLVLETNQRLYVATTVDTADQEAERRYFAFLEEIFPASQAAEQQLKQKLLASGLEPHNFTLPLEQMRVQALLFRDANLPLLSDEQKLTNADDKIRGAQTVTWEGQELTLDQLQPLYQDADRAVRERAWRLAQSRQLETYRASGGETRRVALGRVIVPFDSADAITRKRYTDYAAGRYERTLSPQGERRTLFARDLVGTSDEILERLHADPILPYVSEFRLELPYEFHDEEYRQILHDFVTIIAPGLGWKAAPLLRRSAT